MDKTERVRAEIALIGPGGHGAVLRAAEQYAALDAKLASAIEDLNFGSFCRIEQKRYGVPNEMFVHKVVSRFRSNVWVEVPVQTPAREVVHSHSEEVVGAICCGVDETQVLRYRVQDCQPSNGEWLEENVEATQDDSNGSEVQG